MSYYQFNRQELLQKAKVRYHNRVGKKKLLNIMLLMKKFQNKMRKISSETYLKNKSK